MTAEITAAHDAAVDAALATSNAMPPCPSWPQRHRASVRNGFIAAAFRHCASRAADPYLHTHALVPNMVRSTDDDRWAPSTPATSTPTHSPPTTSTSAPPPRTHPTTRPRLGPIVNGIADIDGLTKPVLESGMK